MKSDEGVMDLRIFEPGSGIFLDAGGMGSRGDRGVDSAIVVDPSGRSSGSPF